MTKSEGTICISVPYSKFWGGTCPPVPTPMLLADVNYWGRDWLEDLARGNMFDQQPQLFGR